jgi:hypothetical protein
MTAEWKQIDIRIAGPEVRRIDALVFGVWAAHEQWNSDDGWRWGVTHVQTGLGLLFMGPIVARDAIACAAALEDANLVVIDALDAEDFWLVEAIVAEVLS